jgi:hypothetical protein
MLVLHDYKFTFYLILTPILRSWNLSLKEALALGLVRESHLDLSFKDDIELVPVISVVDHDLTAFKALVFKLFTQIRNVRCLQIVLLEEVDILDYRC